MCYHITVPSGLDVSWFALALVAEKQGRLDWMKLIYLNESTSVTVTQSYMLLTFGEQKVKKAYIECLQCARNIQCLTCPHLVVYK